MDNKKTPAALIRCKERSFYVFITPDKEYIVLDETRSYFSIINDFDIQVSYPKELFDVIK